jgi:steroid 5-alpha reductase family enzyme
MKAKKKPTTLFFILIALGVCLVLWLKPVKTSNPLESILYITGITASLSFLFGLITGDYSWTDRLWSTMPVVFAWIYALYGGFNLPLLVATILVTLWGARLTFNFARRGGYTTSEDYRWQIIHTRIGNPALWQLFNLLFIALYQQILFIAFTFPLYLLAMHTPVGMSLSLWLASLVFLAFLGIETIADQQQYAFQQAKYGLLPKRAGFAEQYAQGFRSSGLFARSRHPNYLGELGVWFSIYIFASLALGDFLNWSLVGPLALTMLFSISTIFTESITAKKYKAYQQYKKQASAIIFKFW